MRFLADESCDFNVVRALRDHGHDVLAIIQESPGIADVLVIERAMRDVRIVVTEDKDFGQMVFAAVRETSGVVLVRWPADARKSLPLAMVLPRLVVQGQRGGRGGAMNPATRRSRMPPQTMPMSPELQRQLSRFKRLPRIDDVWEGAIAPMPTWIAGEHGGDPYRPMASVWVSTIRQLAHFKMPDEPATVDDAMAISALVEMGTSAKLAGYRPRALRVQDQRLAASLTDALDALDTVVELAPDLPALDAFLLEMAGGVGADTVPAALDAPGVTPERLRSFAEAAKQFYEAAPWRHLGDGDLIRVEAPKAGKGLTLFAVMGAAGRQFGLGFFSSADRYRRMLDGRPPDEVLEHGGEWAVYCSPAWETPFADLAAWDRFRLPLASDRAYPMAVRLDLSRAPQRPDAGRLAYFDGLLRAMAATTEDEMDSGRWSHTVDTADGAVEFVLTLPDLLKSQHQSASSAAARQSLGDPASTVSTPLDRAQNVIYEALPARGRWQLLLIRRALDLSPDCADAYVLLAERSSSPAEQRALYEQAMAAGERVLGSGVFDDPGRSFLRDVSMRPYTRARLGLAECLCALGELDAAAEHFRALLRFNPNDSHGARYRLLTVLLLTNRNDEAEALINEHDDEASALWSYASVLLALRARDTRLARTRLRAALKSNRHVPRYLTGLRDLPEVLPSSYSQGGDDEAVLCASELIEAWSRTPDAAAWLRTETRGRR